MILKHTTLFIAGFLILSSDLFSQAGSFISISNDSRSVAMGNTYVASTGGAFSFFGNLAGLEAGTSKFAVGATYRPWIHDNSLMAFSGYYQFSNKHILSIGIRRFTHPAFVMTDNSGNILGSFSPGESTMGLGYGYRISDKTAFSATLHYLKSELSKGYSGTSLYGDLGFKTVVKGIDLGLMVRNLGSGLSFKYGDVALPLTVTTGGSYRKMVGDQHALRANLDVSYVSLSKEQSGICSGIGGEYTYKSMFSLRGGYSMCDEAVALSAVSLGGGLNLFGGSLDFAWLIADYDLKNNYSISCSWTF